MVFYDTNALLKLGERLKECDAFLISSVTVEELENIKMSSIKDEQIKYEARNVTRILDSDDLSNKCDVIIYDQIIKNILDIHKLDDTPDNKICACAFYASNIYEDVTFCTEDYCCKLVAKHIFHLPVTSLDIKKQKYLGYKEVTLSEEKLADFYQHLSDNKYDLIINEYLIIKDETGSVVDKLKWTGEYYKTVCDRTIKTNMFGTMKPLDEIQSCAIDSIISNEITVLYGRAGSGKTTLPLNYIMQQLEKGKIKKFYVVYSYEPLKNAKQLGFEKGDHVTKLLQYSSIGNILSSKFGDIIEVESMIDRGVLDIIPTANIRGVEFESDSCVIVTECQNLDVYTLKTIIQRCKTGCKQIYEGDIIEQKDTNIQTIGMNRLIEVFKGDVCFGCVKLKNNYRNRIGELADKL